MFLLLKEAIMSKFINFISEGINDVGIFKAIFMAGQPLSGKSYTISKISSGNIGTRIVNTDTWINRFDKEKAKYLTKSQLVLYLNSMLPLFIDSTSTNPSNIVKRKGLLNSIGYDTGMIFINADLETSIKRIEQRERKVPIEYIIKAHNNIEKLKPFYKNEFAFYIEIDNNDGELTNDVIIKSFKSVSKFFTLPLNNPIGIETIDKMLKNKWKYLNNGIHDIQYLNRLVDIWYNK